MSFATINKSDLNALPLAQARTLSSKWYTSDNIFELEQEHIFRRTWQYAGTVSQLQKPGDFFTVDILGEPIVVVLDRDNEVKALSNVCRHRGGPVASGAGNRSVPFFQCRYHAWTYNFDGSVRSAPGLPSLQEEKATLCLPQLRVATWRSLVFVNFDKNAPSLSSVMDGIAEVMKTDPFSDLRFQFRETFNVKCNWKIFQYNSHECYHCRTVHPETVCSILHPESLTTLKSGDLWLYTRYESKAPSDARASDVQSFGMAGLANGAGSATSSEDSSGFYALHLFPNTMITYTPPGYAMLVRLIPQAPGKTLLIRDHYFHDTAAAKIESVRSFREAVIAEDIEICEAVQKNMSARLFDRGRFVAKNEWQSYWFEERVRQYVARGIEGDAA
jgi:choline monooxygenase